MVKVAVERKEAAWKGVLELEMRLQKKDIWKLTKKRRKSLKSVYFKAKKEAKNSLERNESGCKWM